MRAVLIGYRANYGLKANLDVGPIGRTWLEELRDSCKVRS
jgi:hypothetical protein